MYTVNSVTVLLFLASKLGEVLHSNIYYTCFCDWVDTNLHNICLP